MLLTDYKPVSKLVLPKTLIDRPKFPVIDAHDHLGEWFGDWSKRPIQQLLDLLDEANVKVYVDLDGGWGEDILNAHLDAFKNAAPDRFQVFGGVNWEEWGERGDKFGEWAAERFRLQVARGAQGLKIWKNFGLHVKDQHGNLVAVDDSRLDPLWVTVGELKLPVMIHVADPVAFFDPLDEYNERWEELQSNPDWHFQSPPFPPFLTIVNSLARLVERHPQVTFIGAHVGCYSENLAWVSDLINRSPNFYVDIGARISELGRQPYTSRRFFLEHADRILFGTDCGPNPDAYRTYYRFLETEDEYFPYTPSSDIPGQGRWQIYGLNLPDDVLAKVYWHNAERILQL